jgi:hypothetical protein
MTDMMNQTDIQVDNESGHPETIKWTIEKEKYEVHQTILEKVEKVISLHIVYRWCTRLD